MNACRVVQAYMSSNKDVEYNHCVPMQNIVMCPDAEHCNYNVQIIFQFHYQSLVIPDRFTSIV